MTIYIQDYNWCHEVYMILKLLASFILGGLIGWERERAGKEAGIRTFGQICMGACAFSMISQSMNFADPSRIAAQIVLGIGFIGAGIISRDSEGPHGLTTAASLWVSAAVGMSMGFSLYIMGTCLALIIIGSLRLPSTRFWPSFSKKRIKDL